jgi:serine/threonine protein kinase
MISEQPVGPKSDIFSLGIIFYEMLTQINPFGDIPLLAISNIMTKDPAPLPTKFSFELR